ncbi:MAG: penicillin acylase family protein, partial [Saprospiraceae bacterium]|nr:penicillin acylase family protein [Saprospiraceae bacterium]
MNKLLKSCSILILTISSLLSFGQVQLSNIEIVRDSFGVPHIFAPTDEEVAYGLAWATAEDDFVTIQQQLLP